MKFKKGDIVQVWNDEKDSKNLTVYFALNDHPNVEYPHLVRIYNPNSKKTYSGIFAYSHCRQWRSNLKMDGPMWMYKIGWWLWHFPQWPDTGETKSWTDGRTRYTVSDENEYLTSRGYRHSSHQIANKGGRMNLHGKIMNINVIKENLERAMEQSRRSNSTSISDIIAAAYRYGHRDARHAAAELAVGTKFENCTMEGAEKGEGPPIIGEFKKGDQVKVWDYDGQLPVECVYFAFNEHPRAVYSHLVRHSDGNVIAYRYCSHSLPDLDVDDLVWIWGVPEERWLPRYFAGWTDDGQLKHWIDGRTSHTVSDENEYLTSKEYRLSSFLPVRNKS